MPIETKRERVVEAIRELGRPCSVQQIKEQMDRFGYQSLADVPNCLSNLTINDRSRRHNDGENPRDVLIKARLRGTPHVRYWFYDASTDEPSSHVTSEDLDWTYNRAPS
jgi:hypothetical protein